MSHVAVKLSSSWFQQVSASKSCWRAQFFISFVIFCICSFLYKIFLIFLSRYEFTSSGKVRLRELGPRFTLKLRSLQDGTFDSKTGDYRWIITDKRHDMETSRRKFYL
jgi:hypothetical protein